MLGKIKKAFASIFTILLIFVLFGVIFIALDLVDPTPAFGIQTLIISILVIFIRFFWYGEGESRAAREADIITIQKNYGELVSSKIKEQDSLEVFLEKLNQENRDNWVKSKLGNKTPKNCPKYQELKDKYDRQAGWWVKPITSTQILTRSARYAVISAKDYRRRNKAFYQFSSFIISFLLTVIISAVAFENFVFSWGNLFKFITYLFSIVWAMLTSLNQGHKTHITEVTDHISRLTMIVNRYDEWLSKGEYDKCLSDKNQTTKNT